MRSVIAALPLLAPMLALAACGGASGPETVGSIAPPTGGGTSGGTGGTGGGAGGGVGSGGTGTPTPTPTPTATNFLDVATATTFNAVGSFQSLSVEEDGVGGRGVHAYLANASTVRAPSGTVAYDPRDGIFTIQFTDAKADQSSNIRFQDPGFRNTYGGLNQPSWGVPNLADFNYLEVLGPSFRAAGPGDLGRADSITFFYQRPGSQTKYVSLAGFVRNAFDRTADPLIFAAMTTSKFERGAMVFGQDTLRSQIPVSGTGTYTGGMLATMVATTDTNRQTYFQWINGNSTVTLDFSKQTMAMLLTGTVSSAVYGGQELAANQTGAPAGSRFEAKGSGTINLTGTGGFTGTFGGNDAAGLANYVRFVNGTATIPVNTTNVSQGGAVTGASSIDGTFFGPNAVNVGGNVRIVGGVPNQRVDILGAFTGAKAP